MDPFQEVFPIENGDIPASYVSLPEGKFHQIPHDPPNSCLLTRVPASPIWSGVTYTMSEESSVGLFSKWKPSEKKHVRNLRLVNLEIVKAQLWWMVWHLSHGTKPYDQRSRRVWILWSRIEDASQHSTLQFWAHPGCPVTTNIINYMFSRKCLLQTFICYCYWVGG